MGQASPSTERTELEGYRRVPLAVAREASRLAWLYDVTGIDHLACVKLSDDTLWTGDEIPWIGDEAP